MVQKGFSRPPFQSTTHKHTHIIYDGVGWTWEGIQEWSGEN